MSKIPTPKKLRSSIKHDAIHPADWNKYTMPISCEDCTHFDSANESCTLGYESKHHRRERQKSDYELTGKVALCRFLEID